MFLAPRFLARGVVNYYKMIVDGTITNVSTDNDCGLHIFSTIRVDT